MILQNVNFAYKCSGIKQGRLENNQNKNLKMIVGPAPLLSKRGKGYWENQTNLGEPELLGLSSAK
jgi:uncharacterized protein